MYAARRLYVKQWEHQSPDERYTVQIARGGKPVPGIQPDRISVVEEEVMYWRKANHIHGWFVDNVQGDKDDCGTYRIIEEKIRRLLSHCETVIGASKLVDGQVIDSYTFDDNGNKVFQRKPGQVIEDPTAAKLFLPTKAGFFFGCTEYDEDYLDEVIRTRDWAALMLTDIEAGVPGEIYYSSSW